MTDFPGLPEDIYRYENTFNYAVWTPNTTVTLCNVPWDSSYRDVVRFDAEDERAAYFAARFSDGYAFQINGLVYLRYGEPVRVNAPFDMVTRCNYLVVSNPLQPVPPDGRKPEKYYYFINDAAYIAPNTTQLNIQLDVWQTYYDRVHFDMCYVNKGHIGIANENVNMRNLSSYLTDGEGLDIGGEYDLVHMEYINFLDEPPLICVLSSAELQGNLGTVDKPVLNTAVGSIASNLPCGGSFIAIESTDFDEFMQNISSYPWVSQCIQMITAVPRSFVELGVELEVAGVKAHRVAENPGGRQYSMGEWASGFGIPDRYRNLKKFFTFPYCVMEMTGHNGGELILKPECMGTETMDVTVESCVNPCDMRAYAFINGYNREPGKDVSLQYEYYPPDGSGGSEQGFFFGSEQLDFAVCFRNFPQFALVNNSYINYLASNRNSLNYQFAAADWSQQKALTAAQLSYNQATNNMNTAAANQLVANNANWALSGISQEKNAWSGLSSGLSSALGAGNDLASGNFGGAMANVMNIGLAAANTVANQDWINRTTATQVGAATQTTQNNIANQGYMRDTNYDYAQFAAKGDYETAIQGIQAKVQDARLLQPSTSGQNGGEGFNFANGYMGVLFKWKRLKPNFMRQVGDFWLRYGYYVNRWITPPQDLKCMENFTYWKMQNAAISTTEVPETFKNAIRGIFEKGVTVWNDPGKMYKIDLADNEPVKGVRY